MNNVQNFPEAEFLIQTRIVSIVRGITFDMLEPTVSALYEGGIRSIEITMNTSKAAEMIQSLRLDYDKMAWIGAGTVCNVVDAQEAYEAGAQFFVTPNVNEDVIAFALSHNIPIFTGALTVTEILTAYECGSTAIKVFPSTTIGPGYIREIKGPLSDIPLMAVGGINAENINDYFAAGAFAVGVGSYLVQAQQTQRDENYFRQLRDKAQTLISFAASSFTPLS